MTLKEGDKVFIKHMDYVAATVIGPRPGDRGTPEENTRVMVKISEEKRICLNSDLEVETPSKSAADRLADWQRWNETGLRWMANQSSKELAAQFSEACEKIGMKSK